MKRITFVMVLVAFFMVIGVIAASAGDEVTIAPVSAVVEPDMQWIWGEVATVDPQNNRFTIKYLDYETDQEKELSVIIDDKTTFENVKSGVEISPLDTLSLDYMVVGGNNVAKNISVEKPEAQIASEAATTIPEDLQPPAEPSVNVVP